MIYVAVFLLVCIFGPIVMLAVIGTARVEREQSIVVIGDEHEPSTAVLANREFDMAVCLRRFARMRRRWT